MEELKKAISNIKTIPEIREAFSLIKDRLRQIERQECSNFKSGDRVEWTAKGKHHTGTINTVNTKSITIQEDGSSYPNWRVSPGNLKLMKPGDEKFDAPIVTDNKYEFDVWVHPINGGDDTEHSLIIQASTEVKAILEVKKWLGKRSADTSDYRLLKINNVDVQKKE